MSPTIHKRLQATSWAVRLGANTARRLSEEWNICLTQAQRHLQDAYEAGLITRRQENDGLSHPFVYESDVT